MNVLSEQELWLEGMTSEEWLKEHDKEIRVNVIKEFTENIIPTLYENNVDEEVINLCKKLLEQMKGK